jgi:hypothetical protein
MLIRQLKPNYDHSGPGVASVTQYKIRQGHPTHTIVTITYTDGSVRYGCTHCSFVGSTAMAVSHHYGRKKDHPDAWKLVRQQLGFTKPQAKALGRTPMPTKGAEKGPEKPAKAPVPVAQVKVPAGTADRLQGALNDLVAAIADVLMEQTTEVERITKDRDHYKEMWDSFLDQVELAKQVTRR